MVHKECYWNKEWIILGYLEVQDRLNGINKIQILKLNLISGQRQIIDRSMNYITATDPRYERMKAGHPAGFIEAFANIYDDIGDDYEKWIYSSQDIDSANLG